MNEIRVDTLKSIVVLRRAPAISGCGGRDGRTGGGIFRLQ